MKTIATLTMNPAVDLFLEVDRLEPNRKLRCARPSYGAGGGGINVGRAIRRLGESSVAVFPAGGSFGDLLITLLRRESITTDVIRTAGETREDVNVLERATAKEFRFVLPGAELTSDEWQHCLRAIRSLSPKPDYVVASGSLPPGVPVDFYARLASTALQSGFRLIVDTSGEALRHAATKGVFLLKPNVGELAYMSGKSMLTDLLIEGAAEAIVQTKGVDVMVVSAGAGGAITVDGRGVQRISAPLVKVESRVGAGDSMLAGIVVALARGWSVDDAVRFGVAAGSAAVMAPGHQLCRKEDAERLYRDSRTSRTPQEMVPAGSAA